MCTHVVCVWVLFVDIYAIMLEALKKSSHKGIGITITCICTVQRLLKYQYTIAAALAIIASET